MRVVDGHVWDCGINHIVHMYILYSQKMIKNNFALLRPKLRSPNLESFTIDITRTYYALYKYVFLCTLQYAIRFSGPI